MISPHAALEKTTISAMLFCEEIPVFSRAVRGEIIKSSKTCLRINSKLLQS